MFKNNNVRFNSESEFSGDDVEAIQHEISDLLLEQKKVIQAQCGSEKIDSFLNIHTQCTDYRASNTVGFASSETFLNAVKSVYRDPNRWSDIYIVNKKPLFFKLLQTSKKDQIDYSTIHSFRLSSFRLAADYSKIEQKSSNTAEEGI